MRMRDCARCWWGYSLARTRRHLCSSLVACRASLGICSRVMLHFWTNSIGLSGKSFLDRLLNSLLLYCQTLFVVCDPYFYDRLSGSLRELLRPNLVCTKNSFVHTLHSFVWDTAFLFLVEINFIKWLKLKSVISISWVTTGPTTTYQFIY